ncbi:3',5'-cyclic adenosine monophosphate phosphodiesterase CpdA [Arenibacter antarcticus]|uniref:Phosphodiester glycosidase family protein n=1 Tax=Arenibacter antarcticus TaxID=2040469 RepID=A0ABW5VKQ5_9FLAO|nr:phosphodiester glycosidase family protein [Arenibacter sp. H213]MCM4169058.1 hypothetical protein [Arenibacter sp. H213]
MNSNLFGKSNSLFSREINVFIYLFFVFSLLYSFPLFSQELILDWKEREDLNIVLPNSVQIFDAAGTLADGKPIRAVYAKVDLRDPNLDLRSIGSNTIRETTLETNEKSRGILAMNGGYFAANSAVSLIVKDGRTIAPGPTGDRARGAFGMVNGVPEIVWSTGSQEGAAIWKYEKPSTTTKGVKWKPEQAVGGGPVLIKNGALQVTAEEEGFGKSFLIRHPRSAIGYVDKHTLLMMVVDGRQVASVGVTLEELAQLMQGIGAQEALNLDGGGSSAMVAGKEVVNIPTDITGGNRNSLRKNAGALVLSEKVPSIHGEVTILDTESPSYSEIGIWKNSKDSNYYGQTPARSGTVNTINKAVYQLEGIRRNKYQLGVWYIVDKAHSDKVNYVVHSASGIDTLSVNQQSVHQPGKWEVLGSFHLGPGDFIEIIGGGEGRFTTDAIRLVSLKNSPELPERGQMRIAVISDLNSGLGAADYEWQVDSILQRIPRIWKPDLVVCGGDMVAGMGVSDTLQLKKMWEGFNKHIMNPLDKAQVPFAFTVGNHDGPRSYPIEHEATRKFWEKNIDRTRLNFVDRSHFPHYYTFVKDEVFFVSWEASSSVISKENLDWLEKQFKTPEARNAKLRFVMGHMPLYGVAQGRDSRGNLLENPQKLQQLLEDYKVHTYISGHQHSYYPAKKGKLELLNAGVAGSGARAWLGENRPPENTITIIDLFEDGDRLEYTTYTIKERDAAKMEILETSQFPSSMYGVNGHIIRRDINTDFTRAEGNLMSVNGNIAGNTILGNGKVFAEIRGNTLFLEGKLVLLNGSFSKDASVSLGLGRNTEAGKAIEVLKVVRKKRGQLAFKGEMILSRDLKESLAVGGLNILVLWEDQEYRTQLYPVGNSSPEASEILSHLSKNTYGIRNLETIYEVEWQPSLDKDGDFVSYTYQLAEDPDFKNLIWQQKTGREVLFKTTENTWYKLLSGLEEGKAKVFYHRVLSSDGSHTAASKTEVLNLIKSDEPLEDFAEIVAPNYEFVNRIVPSAGGYGAVWDGSNKLWLADYNKGFVIRTAEGEPATFSPLQDVTISGTDYQLSPVNGVGVDLDGNILAGINRRLIKIDANTGKGIAIWEVPKGERAITAPRVNKGGEIYAMSLFADDPNYVLKQNTEDTTKFDLVRTLALKDRILARTFDMSPDGATLYFPDPGMARIQVYGSTDGYNYQQEESITSTYGGSSALRVTRNNTFYVATRSSGISPSTFHYRDANKKQVWTLELPDLDGAEPRGLGVSPDEKTLVFCSWDKGGGYYMFRLKE